MLMIFAILVLGVLLEFIVRGKSTLLGMLTAIILIPIALCGLVCVFITGARYKITYNGEVAYYRRFKRVSPWDDD
jgi:hypothetical protein